jgi:hypothetical protein
MRLCVVLRVTRAPPLTSLALAPRLKAFGARWLDGRFVRVARCGRHWPRDEYWARRRKEQALRDRAHNKLLKMRALLRADDKEIGGDVLGELGKFAGRTTASHMDGESLAFEATERLHLFLEVNTELIGKLLRACCVRLALHHVHNMKVAAGNPTRDPCSLIECVAACCAEVVSYDERESRNLRRV